MDEEETRIDFTFKLERKQNVVFNLIAPIGALKLFVSNTISAEKSLEDVEQSTDGLIEFKKEDISALEFTVSVVKKSKEKHFSHFTIIASTKGNKQRMEPTVTYY